MQQFNSHLKLQFLAPLLWCQNISSVHTLWLWPILAPKPFTLGVYVPVTLWDVPGRLTRVSLAHSRPAVLMCGIYDTHPSARSTELDRSIIQNFLLKTLVGT